MTKDGSDIDQWATAQAIEDLANEMAGRVEYLDAEVERLRAEAQQQIDGLTDENAGLRADIEAKRTAFLAQGEELDQMSAEAERLRDELWKRDGFEGMRIEEKE
jgi:hypothetical protein